MSPIIPAFQAPLLPIAGTDATFPVRRVYCVGRNYAAHAVEMGHDPSRERPFFFQKNPDNLVIDGAPFPYPPLSSDVHHEVELAIALKAGGGDIALADALDCVFGYAVAIDFTRRDLQAEAKKDGRPWAAAKAFEHSAPISAIAPVSVIGHPSAGRISLSVNGALRQDGDLDQMIWKVPEIICELSKLFVLAPGDVILTGTPSGVGAVERGDTVSCGITAVGSLSVAVV